MTTLFSQDSYEPLASRLRPQFLDEIAGQEHLTEDKSSLGVMRKSGQFSSLILWGPSGCGKTTLARLLAKTSDLGLSQFLQLNRVLRISKKLLNMRRSEKKWAGGRFFLWMKFTDLIEPNRMAFCRMLKTEL